MSAEQAAEKPAGGKKMMVIIIAAVLVLVLVVGGVVAFLLLRGGGEEAHAEQEVTKEEPQKKEKKKKKKDKEEGHAAPIFEKLETFTVNLSGSENMLQVELHLELPDEKMKETLKSFMPKVRNDINLLLRSKKLDDLRSDEGTRKLIDELKETVNKSMDVEEDEGVQSVAISSMIVQ